MLHAEILLSYYNGKRYIEEQISSILNQTWDGFITIRIRDDGSSDNESSIRLKQHIRNLTLPENRKVLYYRGRNLGPQKSFLQLIRHASPHTNFYFFSDQDDVWKPEKVERAVGLLRTESEPALYCCNYSVTDEKLRILEDRAVNISQNTFHFIRAVFFNTFPGCTMGFNRLLLNALKELNLSDCMMHDSVTFATAILLGRVLYDDKPLLLHRIHDENVIGKGYAKIRPVNWVKEKVSLVAGGHSVDLRRFMEALLHLADSGNDSSSRWIGDVYDVMDYKKSFYSRIKLILHPDMRRKPDRWTLSVYCRILFGLY